LVLRVFPKIDDWRMQMTDPVRGDESEAAQNFLNMLLPYLARVLLQDSIYWITHEAKRLLLHIMPPTFQQWAVGARQWCRVQQLNFAQSQITALNQAAQAAYQQTQQGVQGLEQKLDVINQHQQNFEARMLQEFASLRQLFNAGGPMGGNGGGDDGANGGNGGAGPLAIAQNHYCVAPVNRLPNPHVNVNTALRPTPQIPAFPTVMPPSMVALLNEHNAGALSRFEHAKNKKEWQQSIRNSFSKRLYLYKKIEAKANGLRAHGEARASQLLRAAKILDEERQGRSLPQFLRDLKEDDPATKKRRREIDA
jgi:hypothetical protein